MLLLLYYRSTCPNVTSVLEIQMLDNRFISAYLKGIYVTEKKKILHSQKFVLAKHHELKQFMKMFICGTRK